MSSASSRLAAIGVGLSQLTQLPKAQTFLIRDTQVSVSLPLTGYHS
jgi:hypothetical protein